MPVDPSASDGASSPRNEGSMFAPTPLWDRDLKKRRGRRAAASRPVSDPAIDAGEAGAGAGAMGATTAAEPADAAYETQPVWTTAPVPARRGAWPVVIGAGAVAALAAVIWYASRPHDSGVAELTPGAPATSTTALNTVPPPSASQVPPTAVTTPQTTATTRETTTTTRTATSPTTRRTTTTTVARAPAHRVRPAEPSSAMDAAVNASTTAPMIATPPPPAPAQSTAVNPTPVAPAVPPAPATTSPPPVDTPEPTTPANPAVTP